MNNGILVNESYTNTGFENDLPKPLYESPNCGIVDMPYHYPPANNWKNNYQQNIIFVIDTRKDSNTTIQFELYYGPTNAVVDWGDGTFNRYIVTSAVQATHTYKTHGVYTINISGSIASFWTHRVGGSNIGLRKIIECLSLGRVTYLSLGLLNCSNLIRLPDSLPPGVSFIDGMLRNCSQLVRGGENWDLSNATNLIQLFENCLRYNENLSKWNTSNVTNMSAMFNNASSFNQDLSSWDVRKVTTFANMFQGATNFNGSLSGWAPGADTTGTSCANMFQSATNFTGIGLDSWDTSKVTNMNRMFVGIVNFNANVSSWNTSNVTNMTETFSAEGGIFNQNISGWDTSKVTTMASMFRGNRSFDQPIGSWNVSNVNSMSFMFAGLGGFRSPFSQDISSWDIRKVTTMDFMFQTNALWGTTNYSNALIAWAALPDTDLKSQAITAFAASSANTLVTSNNHGLVAGSRVNITGTTNYNGNYNVLSSPAPTANTFVIAKTFVSNDATGTMNHRRSRNVVAGFAANKYTAGAAADARNVLVSTYGWTITDGGLA